MTDSQNLPASSSHPEPRRWHYLLPRRFFWWSGLVLGLSVMCVALVVMLGQPRDDHALIHGLLLALTAILLLSLAAMLLGAQRWLLDPLLALRDWASNIRQGDFSSRLPRSDTSKIGELADDINRLSEWLESLAEERERELQAQQQRLEERTQLANELHDSLAQTLASLKFQIRVLDDTLRQDNEAAIWQEMERIESSIDEANVELRELITYFRLPMDGSGAVSAIEKTISRFRLTSSVKVVLQNHWPVVELSGEMERQIVRIVQEALANVRKHSDADMVRVLLDHDENTRRVLIEDDGVGMNLDINPPDNRFGLTIMRERAVGIGATLQIDSEPGEGTRIVLNLPNTMA